FSWRIVRIFAPSSRRRSRSTGGTSVGWVVACLRVLVDPESMPRRMSVDPALTSELDFERRALCIVYALYCTICVVTSETLKYNACARAAFAGRVFLMSDFEADPGRYTHWKLHID